MSNTRLQRDAAKLCKMIEEWRKYGIAEHIVVQAAKVRDAIRAEKRHVLSVLPQDSKEKA